MEIRIQTRRSPLTDPKPLPPTLNAFQWLQSTPTILEGMKQHEDAVSFSGNTKVVRHLMRHKDVIVSKLRANKIINEMTIMFVQLKMKPKIVRAN